MRAMENDLDKVKSKLAKATTENSLKNKYKRDTTITNKKTVLVLDNLKKNTDYLKKIRRNWPMQGMRLGVTDNKRRDN